MAVTIYQVEKKHIILFHTGYSQVGVPHNMAQPGLKLDKIGRLEAGYFKKTRNPKSILTGGIMKTSMHIIFTVIALFLLNLAACSSGKYSDVKKVTNDQAKTMGNYATAIEKAESVQDVVAAINNFTSEMKTLMPEMKRTLEKYPELTDNQPPPEELKEDAEKMRALNERLQSAMMKTMQYMQDPEVQKAFEEQGKVMMEMGKSSS